MNDEICVGNNFSTFEEQDKVLVAFSGGVDSSVAIRILQDQGFSVQAVFIRFSAAQDRVVDAARTVAAQLNVPLIIEDCSELFEEAIIKPFCKSYCEGSTPSPCVSCNPLVKFKTLTAVADRLGIRLIATGHYARVTEVDGIYYLQTAMSKQRDQSYMLYGLSQDVLSRLCLPVGEFEKTAVREMAGDAGIASADTPDSQEICFVPDGDYAEFIKKRGMTAKQGRFIGPDGEDLGAHKGVMHYTVGQRKGLNIAYGKPVFVKRIQENGDVLLALSGDEFYAGVLLNRIHSTNGTPFNVGDKTTVKVRSRALPVPCSIVAIDGDTMTILFDEPQRAPAPGQAAVFYCDGLIVGGGIITEMVECDA